MKHFGIVCEYNPFHSGHARLIAAARREGGETAVCLMSGCFTQRGEAAILPPHVRAEMALAAGADLVLELPYPYAAASARYFATAGVRGLAALGVDTLAFGSECADLALLQAAADRTLDPDFQKKVQNGARNKGDAALYFEALGEARISPNDILGLEYLRAIRKAKLPLTPFLLKREGAGYHDTDADALHPSATALRALIGTEEITARLLFETVPAFEKGMADYGQADTARLGGALLAILRGMKAKTPATGAENPAFADAGGGLLERLADVAHTATDHESLCRLAATKKYTDGRIRRVLLYLLTGVTRQDLTATPSYLRLLGANEKGRAFLSETRKTRTVPVVTKAADIAALGERAARQRALEQVAQGIYALCLPRAVSPAVLDTHPPVML